jgi:CheY-like chemotaxis protein
MTRPDRPLILVVEDDSDIRESVVEVLEDEGYRVLSAADGRQALSVLTSLPEAPALILLDLMMPIMNGFQFREEQLKTPALAAVPVVVVTADVNAKNKADQLRAAAFVQKPLKIQTLLDIIESHLARA